MISLSRHCDAYLKRLIDVGNVLDIRHFASDHNGTQTINDADAFIIIRFMFFKHLKIAPFLQMNVSTEFRKNILHFFLLQRNFLEVAQCENFKQLDLDYLLQLLSSDDLYVNKMISQISN
jgi:hypothetical protein